MHFHEKINLTLDAIIKSRKKGAIPFVTLNVTSFPKKLKITKSDISQALHHLEHKEFVLHVYPKPIVQIPEDQRNDEFVMAPGVTRPKPYLRSHTIVIPLSKTELLEEKRRPSLEESDFVIKLYPRFEDWLSAYRLRNGNNLSKFPKKDLQSLIKLLVLIDQEMHLKSSQRFSLTLKNNPKDTLSLLYERGILEYFECTEDLPKTYMVQLILVSNKFDKFYIETYREFPRIFKRFGGLSKEKIVYKLTKNWNGEIFLNGQLFAKPDYDGENSQVISYLLEHPNKKVTKQEIEGSTKRSIGKDFHKIIDNLGFTKDLKKMFFPGVTTAALSFRNPITEEVFATLKIRPIKLKKLKRAA